MEQNLPASSHSEKQFQQHHKGKLKESFEI
jgi:hypothetical protein